MSDDDPDDTSFEARLRWFAEQVSRSVEDLGELDFDLIARRAGVDVERARELIDGAEQWITTQADEVVKEAVARFGDLLGARMGEPRSGTAPHPLDMPTPEQGLALSAVDSGRWTVKPGSHVLSAEGEGPPPADADGLVGELRARDWISAGGEVTLMGHNALKRWAEQSDVSPGSDAA